MRTTVTLDDDTAAVVARLRRERGLGVSAAVNELLRHGALRASTGARPPFVQRTSEGHALLDVTNVGDVLEILDGEP